MRLIQEAADQELVWRQPSGMKYEYELRAGDEILATLRFKSSLGTLAAAEAAEGAWTFKRAGFWQTRITVRPRDGEREIAAFRPEWTGNGVLTLEGGRIYRWAGANFWRTHHAWQAPGDVQVVRFENTAALKNEGRVILSAEAAALPETAGVDELYRPVPPEALAPPSVALPELPLLVTLGWYLTVLEYRDAAAAVVAIT